MRLYFAGAEAQLDLLRAEGVTRVLVSFVNVRTWTGAQLDRLSDFEVFLDSGAWSVASGAAAPIDVADYSAFVKRTAMLWQVTAALDVIGDADASWRNYEAMRQAGLTWVLPTWHAGEPLDAAVRMAEAAPYVAVGGLAGHSKRRAVAPLIAKVWPHVKHRKVHLFGVGREMELRTFAPASFDHSGWAIASAHGRVYSLQGLALHQLSATMRERGADQYQRFRKQVVGARLEEFRRYGFGWPELAQSAEARLRYNVRILREFERRLQARAAPAQHAEAP